MSEDGEMWSAIHKDRQAKRWKNVEQSLRLLKAKGIEYETLSEVNAHYRVKGINFWPSTGKYYDPRTGKKGRGIMNLLKII